LPWKDQIDQLMLKLWTSCDVIRFAKRFMSQDNLRTIYFLYFHSISSYDIFFCSNSEESLNNFQLKRLIRIVINPRNRDSCCRFFKNLKSLLLKSQYIFSLLLFVAKHRFIWIKFRNSWYQHQI
jgi:hypothetical protein